MDKTAKLGLNLPGAEDYAEIAILNDNWRKLDAAVSAAMAAGEYDPERAYAVGDYCVVDGVLYRCVTAIPAGEAWNAGHWAATSIEVELKDMAAALAGKAAAIHGERHAADGEDPVTPGAIGAAVAPSPVVVTFPVAGWAKNSSTGCYEQTVNCSGLLASDDKRTTVSPVGSTDAAAQKLTDAAEALVDRYACTTNGKLYARCPEKAPTVAFQVAVTIVRG